MSILSMSKTLFKSLIHGSYTVLYPKKQKKNYERTRGRVEIDISKCIYCGLCQRRCPTGAIKVDKAAATWSIDRLKCIQCNYCNEVCPKKCLSMDNEYTKPSYGGVRDDYTNARVSDNQENN
ncbi:MAG: NAD(P)H-quinone oxidoreductase subunit I [Lachnoclostridium sp.]|jgi:ech hydrogenase subunit F